MDIPIPVKIQCTAKRLEDYSVDTFSLAVILLLKYATNELLLTLVTS